MDPPLDWWLHNPSALVSHYHNQTLAVCRDKLFLQKVCVRHTFHIFFDPLTLTSRPTKSEWEPKLTVGAQDWSGNLRLRPTTWRLRPWMLAHVLLWLLGEADTQRCRIKWCFSCSSFSKLILFVIWQKCKERCKPGSKVMQVGGGGHSPLSSSPHSWLTEGSTFSGQPARGWKGICQRSGPNPSQPWSHPPGSVVLESVSVYAGLVSRWECSCLSYWQCWKRRETSRVENINQTVLLTLKGSETLNECIHVNSTSRAAGQKFILHHEA